MTTTADDTDIDLYRQAGKSKNTHDTYLKAVNHFRDIWGGLLPASPKVVAKYLAAQAGSVKVSTMRVRLAGLSKWHTSQGFFDPTKAEVVKDVMKGIARVHQTEPEQAHALTFNHLKAICDRLEADKKAAIGREDQIGIMRTHRDLALLLCGFWQGFRSDELTRIRIEQVRFVTSGAMTIFLPFSKTDTAGKGHTYTLPALRLYCPVTALRHWIELAGLARGPAFRKIDRWGNVSASGLNKRSVETVLNRVSKELFPGEPSFTTHSLRRGFAHWAVENGWDTKTLMQHVGWRSEGNAMRYMPVRKDYGALTCQTEDKAIALDVGISGADGQTFVASHQQIDENP